MLIASLKAAIRGRVVCETDPTYDQARKLFNERFSQTPLAIVYAADTEDVARTVSIARDANVRLTVRSGGMSPAGFSANDGGVVVDLSELAENTIDVTGPCARIGAGATMEAVYPALQEHGMVLPAGECPRVAVSGLTLGGGVSLLSRSLGATSDSLRQATVVTASGEIVDADARSHPDLFWALRGAGASYGVTTSLEFDLSPIESEVLVGRLTWRPTSGVRVLRHVLDYLYTDAPDGLGVEVTAVKGSLRLDTVYNGPVEDGRDVIAELLADVPPAEGKPEPVPYGSFLHRQFQRLRGQLYAFWRSGFVEVPPTDEALKTMLDGVARSTSPGDLAAIELVNGAVHATAPADTAFVHRDQFALVSIFANWLSGTNTPGQTDWAEDLYEALSPIYSGSHYQNYPHRGLRDWELAYYGANYPRLQEIKARYDPDDVFNFGQSIRAP